MQLKFAHLHNHSTYSFLDGYGTPERHVEIAVDAGYDSHALTEHGNMYSGPKLQIAAEAAGINPIFGNEMYVVDDVTIRNKDVRFDYVHLTVLAKSQQGLQNLMALTTKSYQEGFYQKPKIDWKMLHQHRRGLVVLSGCWSGFLNNMKRKRTKQQKIKWVQTMKQWFGEDFYLEVMPHQHPHQERINALHIELSKLCGVPIVATNDCHYPNHEDHHSQDLMVCIGSNAFYNDKDRRRYAGYELYIKPPKVVLAELMEVGFTRKQAEKAMATAWEIAQQTDARLPRADPIEFNYDGDKLELLKQKCKEGWSRMNLPATKEYRERFERELSLIKEKGFLDYFLIVADVCEEARRRGIMIGPARGSSCGSLVCCALGITSVDPIPYDLMFERFIDVNRTDLPDIDIDFQDDRAGEIQEYLEQRYGKDNVGQIVTFSHFNGKGALKAAARIHKVPYWASDKIGEVLLERSGGDSRHSFTIEDTVQRFDQAKAMAQKFPNILDAQYIEGQVRHTSKHAAGLILSTAKPLSHYFPVNREGAFALDMKDAERMGHLKIDVLRLNTLTVLAQAKELIDKRHNDEEEVVPMYQFFNDIPLDDEDVYEAFSSGKLYGVFQFEGNATSGICMKVKPDNFMELAHINALSRPGPLFCGGTKHYIARKQGKEKIRYYHPDVKEITQFTLGIIIYQEQVMRIVRECAGLSWADTNALRKVISKRMGIEDFNKLEDKFIDGVDWDEKTARHVWSDICTFGSWAFNLSHAVAYAHVAYWCMWMKVHYPQEFFAAMAMASTNEDRVKRSLREYTREGGKIARVDINRCKARFSIQGDKLYPGFINLKGVGIKAAQAIESHQPYKHLADFEERVPRRQCNKTVRAVLHNVCAFGKESQPEMAYGEAQSEYCTWNFDEVDFSECRGNLPAIEDVHNSKAYRRKANVTVIGKLQKIDPRDYREDRQAWTQAIARSITDGLYQFANLLVEDETDSIICQVDRHDYPGLKNAIFEIGKGGNAKVRGTIIDGIRKKIKVRSITPFTEKE